MVFKENQSSYLWCNVTSLIEKKPKGLRLRGKTWWIDKIVRVGEKRVRIFESTKARDLSLAIYILERRTEEVMAENGRFPSDKHGDLSAPWVCRLLKNCQKRIGKREVDITPDDIKKMIFRSRGKCEVTGIPFDLSVTADGKKNPFSPSIDRIDISKGYTEANCRLVCMIANYAMNEWGESALFELVEKTRKYRRFS